MCPSILTSGGQTGGPIGTGAATFDGPERRNDFGAGHAAIGVTCYVPRGAHQSPAKIIIWRSWSCGSTENVTMASTDTSCKGVKSWRVLVMSGARDTPQGGVHLFR